MPKRPQESMPGFDRIAPSIWGRVPTPTDEKYSSNGDASSPDVILVFSWTGAVLRHVSKYTKHYEELYPSSTILLITTTIKDLCWRSSDRKQMRLRPAIDCITEGKPNKSVLVHCFSEGGSNKAVEFAEAYYNTTGEKLPVSALCLDSTPGHPRYQKLCGAFSRSLGRNKAARAVGLVIGTVVLGTFWITYSAVKGRENNVISKTRNRINDEKYWNVKAPRCYLYSEADNMIHWEDVRDHLDAAASAGVPVCAMRFANSEHCRHADKSKEAYWEAVVETWAKGQPQTRAEKDEMIKRLSQRFSQRISPSRGTSLLFSDDSMTEVSNHLSIIDEKRAFKRLSSRMSFGPTFKMVVHPPRMSVQSQRLSVPAPRKSFSPDGRESTMDPLSMYFKIREY
jgi:hypothetical protein